MKPLWTAEDVLRATRGESFHEQSWSVNRVCADSRLVQKGDLFIALKGPLYDGHDFVGEAFARGAVAAVVQRSLPRVSPDFPLVTVDNAYEALLDLARAARARTKGRMIAIGGSLGRATTKDLLHLVLQSVSTCYANDRSQNGLIGLPLSLANMPEDVSFAAFEIAAEDPSDSETLSRLVAPHLVTLVGLAETPGDAQDETRLAGIEALCAGLSAESMLILPRGTVHYDRLLTLAKKRGIKKILSHGRSARADAAILASTRSDRGVAVEARILDTPIAFGFSVPGPHLETSATAALLSAALLGQDPVACAESLPAYRPRAGYGAMTSLSLGLGESVLLFDESAEATIDSLQSALAVLADAPKPPQGRRILILGDLNDARGEEQSLTAKLFSLIEENKVDLVYCCGENMEALANVVPSSKRGGYRFRAEDLFARLSTTLADGDVLMVKGSATARLSVLVESLIESFTAALPESRLAC